MATGARLDLNKPYGQVYGPGDETEGAVYIQDGLFYTADREVMPTHHLYNKEQASKAAIASASAEEPDPEPEPSSPSPPVRPPVKGKKAGDVDLKAWALSEEEYPFLAVRAAIMNRFHFTATDAKAARDFLIDHGVVKESDMK